MAIRPVDLPSAAGIDYGGDVRHFSPGDAVDVPGLQNPTRYLAERDNLLADKVNEVVGVVNNREQFVPLPLVSTILSPNESMVVTNYRIPAGFESRILNAAISASPSSQDIELDVYYNAGSFGGETGTSIVSTASEFNGGASFYQTGEFIVSLKNKSSVTLQLAASVMLTLRPVGATGSLLAASVVTGPQGLPGPTGPPGPAGTPGSGGVGSPGMIWSGTYQAGHTYTAKEVVSYNLYGSLTSSFIAQTTTTEDPQTSYLSGDGVWSPVAIGGVGPAGPAGSSGAAGTNVPSVLTQNVYGTLYTGSNWNLSSINGYTDVIIDAYGGTVALSGAHTYKFPLRETYIESVTANIGYLRGMAVLEGVFRIAFTGDGTIHMPTTALSNSRIDYNASNSDVSLSMQGTIANISSATPLVSCAVYDGTTFVIKSTNPTPVWSQVSFHGAGAY